jgi:CheY-like chemotaxis protein
LKQVLINLLSNAIKFTDNGWIELKVRYTNKHKRLIFAIADSGIGIEPDALDNLFKPFSQANESITRQFGGTGLGLNISAHLVHALGGIIEVASEPQKGSTFTFFITPQFDGAPRFITEMPGDEEPTAQHQRQNIKLSGRVLFADDALDNRRLVDHLLRKVGVETVLVEDGQQAIDTALSDEFDLILLDVQMPNVDGLSAARTLRQAGLRTPIVSLSAGAMTSDVLKAIDAGCSMHLAKPFTKESFMGMLQKFLTQEAPQEPTAIPVLSSKFSDDAEMNELVIEFIDSLSPRIAELSSSCEALDWPIIESRAHKLRGSAGLYGYKDLFELCEQLESQAKHRQGDVAPLLSQITALAERIIAGREIIAAPPIAPTHA